MKTITLNIDADKMVEIFNAFNALDGHEKPVKIGGEIQMTRASYILGPTVRRILVKNMIVLRAAVTAHDEVKKSILKELWPDAPDLSKGIPIQEFPEGIFAEFQKAVLEAAKVKEDIKLFTLYSEEVYKNQNELPLNALTSLEENGLIVDKAE